MALTPSETRGADARDWLTVTLLKRREKVLKPFGRPGCRAERIRVRSASARGCSRLRGRRRHGRTPRTVATRHGSRESWPSGKPRPASGERVGLAASAPGTLAGFGRVRASKRSIRRAGSEPPRLPQRSLSNTAKVGEPAYPVYNTWFGDGSALRTRYTVNLLKVGYVPMVGTTPQATRAPPPPSGAGVSE